MNRYLSLIVTVLATLLILVSSISFADLPGSHRGPGLEASREQGGRGKKRVLHSARVRRVRATAVKSVSVENEDAKLLEAIFVEDAGLASGDSHACSHSEDDCR